MDGGAWWATVHGVTKSQTDSFGRVRNIDNHNDKHNLIKHSFQGLWGQEDWMSNSISRAKAGPSHHRESTSD